MSTITSAVVALAVWFGGLAAAAAWLEPTREVIVFAPRDRIGAALAGAGVAIVDDPGGALRVRGTAPGFVRALYDGGAMLVLPAAAGGCRGGYRLSDRSAP